MLLVIVAALALILISAWMAAAVNLRRHDLSDHDHAPNQPLNKTVPPSTAHHEVVDLVSGLSSGGSNRPPRKQLIAGIRDALDAMGDGADLTDMEIRQIPDPKGEWVLAPNSNPDKRLLYIHGGAFMAGSPRSHRTITTKYARQQGAAVFAVDYRLLPEHKRLDCLTDCQAAYRWLLDNGPEGPGAAREVIVSGDSAGGNLTLVIAAWARDAGLRQPDSVVAIAPLTDNTFTSPTLASNINSDPMLGQAVGRLASLPKSLMYWFNWLNMRVKPTDPRVSPVHGDLTALPPTLIHASEAELLLGDARRYANKAAAQGSPVTLATWEHMVHVWHAFEPSLPEAQQAFEHIDSFLKENAAI